MRIIGGKHRGKKLIAPQTSHIRPTTDRMRESLFNMLEHGTGSGISGANILDLFAGSGALGLEAISRDAHHVIFIDKDPRSMKLVNQNIDLLNCVDNTSCITKDYENITKSLGKFDLIFIDPPYRKEMITPALKIIHQQNLLNKDGLAIIEYAADEDINFTDHFVQLKLRKMGDATFSILGYTL